MSQTFETVVESPPFLLCAAQHLIAEALQDRIMAYSVILCHHTLPLAQAFMTSIVLINFKHPYIFSNILKHSGNSFRYSMTYLDLIYPYYTLSNIYPLYTLSLLFRPSSVTSFGPSLTIYAFSSLDMIVLH